MSELLWLHSGGAFNKEPENDLGNYPSRFELSGEPPDEPNTMNNLFDDVTPEESTSGNTDYRCFYMWNKNATFALTDITLNLEVCEACIPDIEFGSKLQDEVQQIKITCDGNGSPEVGGYVIFDVGFGFPFTVTYNGDWAQFATDLQSLINEQPWCEDVTVTGTNPFIITYTGGVGNRRMPPIRIIQNNLVNNGLCTYNTQIYFSCDDYNGYGDAIVRVVQKISDNVPNTGTLRIYNPLTGLWDAYDYFSHDDYNFSLLQNLEFNLVGFLGSCPPTDKSNSTNDPNLQGDDEQLLDDSQNWQRWFPSPAFDDPSGNPQPMPAPWGVIEVEPCPEGKTCQICVEKVTEGSPINCIATPIPTENDEPDASFFELNMSIGNLRPNEGFFLWVKRTTPPSGLPCLRAYFDITASGTKVSWPLTTP